MPGGRPSKWDDRYVAVALRLALLGKTDPEIAALLGVSKATLNTWKKQHPGFLDALNSGRAPADGRVAASLFQRAIGYSHDEEKVFLDRNGAVVRVTVKKHYPPDTFAAIAWLNNRQRQLWYKTTARQPVDERDPNETANGIADALRAMADLDGLGLPLPPDDAIQRAVDGDTAPTPLKRKKRGTE